VIRSRPPGVRWHSPWQRHWQVRRTAIQSGEARQGGRVRFENSESTISVVHAPAGPRDRVIAGLAGEATAHVTVAGGAATGAVAVAASA
jgi:hypothetical protein